MEQSLKDQRQARSIAALQNLIDVAQEGGYAEADIMLANGKIMRFSAGNQPERRQPTTSVLLAEAEIKEKPVEVSEKVKNADGQTVHVCCGTRFRHAKTCSAKKGTWEHQKQKRSAPTASATVGADTTVKKLFECEDCGTRLHADPMSDIECECGSTNVWPINS